MIKIRYIMYFVILFTLLVNGFTACKKEIISDPNTDYFQLNYIHFGTYVVNLNSGASNINAPIDQPIVLSFSIPLNITSINAISLTGPDGAVDLNESFLDENKTISFSHLPLENNASYTLDITQNLTGVGGEIFKGFSVTLQTQAGTLMITSLIIDGKDLLSESRTTNVNREPETIITFNHPVDPATVNSAAAAIARPGFNEPLEFDLSDDKTILTINTSSTLVHFQKYTFTLSNNLHAENDIYIFNGFSDNFYTEIDSTPKFPIVSDDELLTIVQQQTFKYFWDFGHPVSGLSAERNTTPNVVTIGGSGFGVMSIIVAMDRNFISRSEGVTRLNTIVDFLTTADRFHGVWPHWMNGNTGEVIPFSPNDNGADLVETSYLIQGLLCVRQYLNGADPFENALKGKINTLWETVEWDWFTKGGEDVLYWHWSPDLGWAMNMQIKGFNECLITYFLAAASTTHTIDASVYHNGWADSDYFINGNNYYGYTLPLGFPYGGPLFFAHYSFLGINPTTLSDTYANYWTQNQNHTLINRAYCIDNPQDFVGYSEDCWGLTASDNQNGYSAHSPTNDLGVITPTAAIASIPYTPEYSLDAIRFFYYTIGDKIWGEYGFTDAFNATEGWFATSYLAIDQGPMIVMIENHRTQLLWNLFMSCPEVIDAAEKLSFTY